MESRYRKLPAKPYGAADLQLLLSYARPTSGDYAIGGAAAVEARRKKAILELLKFARAEVAKTGDPNRLRALPFELRHFLEIEGLRLLLSADPVKALKGFLGKRRGRPTEDNERRDIMIAADVAKLVNGGMPIDDACRVIEKDAPVGFEMVRKIYLTRRDTDEVMLASLNVEEFDGILKGARDGTG